MMDSTNLQIYQVDREFICKGDTGICSLNSVGVNDHHTHDIMQLKSGLMTYLYLALSLFLAVGFMGLAWNIRLNTITNIIVFI